MSRFLWFTVYIIEQAMGHRVIGHWVECVTFLDGSPGSHSSMTHVCLYEHIIYHTFMIMLMSASASQDCND